jgi:predicted RNA-binding Zn-ribbon protein involved in translation (DUF1610 family)
MGHILKRGKNSKPLIGFTPSETDFLLWPQNKSQDFKCLVAQGTAEDRWISQFLLPSQIIRYSLKKKIGSLENTEYDELFVKSEITAKIKNRYTTLLCTKCGCQITPPPQKFLPQILCPVCGNEIMLE